MIAPEKFINAFAEYVQKDRSKILYVYAGYSQSTGALLLRDRGTQQRVVVRPWLRTRPVGLQDVARSNERYRVFRGQEPSAYIHVAGEFRENARRGTQMGRPSSLIALSDNSNKIDISGSKNLPQAVLDALLAFASSRSYTVAYDFVGTVVQASSTRRPNKKIDKVVQRVVNPKLFISYSWDSEAHRRWVLKLAADLIRNGVDALIDEWNLPDFDDDLQRFMETGIREASYVLLVCTPKYALRANARRGGVGVESTIVTGEFYDASRARKFVAITRDAHDGPQDALPSFLKSRLAIDFTDDNTYRKRLDELLRRLFNQPRYRRPELGVVPDLDIEDV